MKSNKVKYACPHCGASVYSNLIMNHMRNRCTAGDDLVRELEQLFSIKKRSAWMSALGEEAYRIDNWRPLIWTGEIDIKELSFKPPRKIGVMRPSARKEMSMRRAGRGNPSIKGKPLYEKDEISRVLLGAWEDWQTDHLLYRGIADFCRTIENRLPFWRYSYAGLYLHNTPAEKTLAILANATGLRKEEISAWLRQCRGNRISIGQNNPETKRKLSASAYAALSGRRITKPHLRLFNMVRELDPGAKIEFKIDGPVGSRFFDVFSPLANACIEMHGRVWHDTSATTISLAAICEKNVRNDAIKKGMALSAGYDYTVFWDDKQSEWSDSLEKYFEDKVRKEPGKDACLGHGDASRA